MQKSVIFYTEGVYYMNKEYDLWNEYGMTQRENNIKLGLYTSYQWKNSRRHLLFTIARYKFAMKMIGNIYEKDEKSILDIGCNDGFGTYFISEYAKKVIGVDFDRDAIDFAIANSESNVIEYKCEDFLNKKYGDFDGVISFDVIEHIYPDYSLYGITDTAYGFLSRGCPRGCEFCHVAAKEGKCSYKVADLSEFWHGQKNIILCDPNVIACPDWKELLQQLIDSKAIVNINQGIDIRIMTDEKAEMIKRIRVYNVHFFSGGA